MAVPRNLTHLAFAAGLDESTEDELLDPTSGFAVLENVRQDKRGGVSKRLGFDALTTDRIDASSRSTSRRACAHRGAPCVIDAAGAADVYVSAIQASKVAGGTAPLCTASLLPLAASVTIDAPPQYDAVVCNGMLILAYASWNQGFAKSSGPKLSISYASDPIVPIRSDDFGAVAGELFHLGVLGDTVLLVVGRDSSANVELYTLDCTSVTTALAGWTFVDYIATDRSASSIAFSMCTMASSCAIAYANNAGGTSQMSVVTFDATGDLATVNINTSGSMPDQVGIDGGAGSTLWIVWNASTDVKAAGLDPSTLVPLTGAATVISGTGLMTTQPPSILSTGSASAILYASPAAGSRLVRVAMSHSGGTVTVDDSIDGQGARIAGQPFTVGGRVYGLFTAWDSVTVSYSVVLGDITDRTSTSQTKIIPQAFFAPGRTATDMSARAVTLPDGRTGLVISVVTASSVRSYFVVALNFSDRFIWRSVAHNGVTFLSGGLLTYLSTDRVQEASFLQPPIGVEASNTGTVGNPTGDLRYVAVFESVDGAGNLSVSGASDPFLLTATGHVVLVECPPLLITGRSNVQLAFYRTTNGGKLYHRIGSCPALISGAGNAGIQDDTSDASLESLPLLNGTGLLPGTGGSPLQREAPPYCNAVVSFADMLVVASGPDLWWSGQTIGGEGTWFSAEQFFLTVEGEGDITALHVQDGTLYVFKERAIWIVPGETPADNGSAGGLGTPRRIAGDVGCIEPTSIVGTSIGIFFRSHRGIELLGRGGGAAWIGEKVQRTLASYPYITSAVLDIRNNLVRFSLAKSITAGLVDPYVYDPPDGEDPVAHESGGGRDIVYDLTLGDWQSVDIKTGSTAKEASQDAFVYTVGGEQRYAWLGRDGVVHVETDGYLDGSSWITMAAETGWFKTAGIQGRQQVNRLLFLARLRSDTNLSVSLGYDYGAYATARTWTAAEINALLTAGWPITQLRHDPNDNADGQAVRVRVEETEPQDIGSGQGATWLALTLDITPKEGPAEVPEEAA